MSELDPRWQTALRRHADVEATPEAWEAITGRAEGDVRIPAPTGRPWLAAAAVVVLLALGGIGLLVSRAADDDGVVTADSTTTTDTTEPTATTHPALASGDPVISVRGEVVTDATGTHLCGGYAETLVATLGPPTCGQIPLIGWDWDTIVGERTEGATTSIAQASVIGVYDGETITVLDEVPEGLDPPEPNDDEDDLDRFAPPCPTPPGGWAVTNPDLMAYEDLMAMRSVAERDPQFAGIWVDEMAAPPHGVYTVAFTDELDRHRTELAARWGGPICVTDREVTAHALRAAVDALGVEDEEGVVVDGFALDVTSVGPDPQAGRIEVGVIFAPEGTEEVLEDLLGVPVRVTSFMQRIG